MPAHTLLRGRAARLAIGLALPFLTVVGDTPAETGAARAQRPTLPAAPAIDLISGRRLASPGSAEELAAFRAPPSLVDRVQSGSAPAGPYHPIRGGFGYGDAAARFGNNRGDHMHEGQDVFAPAGTPLVSVLDAVVVESGSDGGRGNYVALYSPRTRATYLYLHMQAPALVPVGGQVRAGQRVGSVGCTGSCFGDHLHFEIRKGRGTTGTPVDPLPGLQRWSRAPASA